MAQIEAGHIQLTEYRKETIPYLNWMFEDLFCRYSLSIPYYLLDFSFPDYPLNAEWPAPYTPEWLKLYKPSLPEMLWPQSPGLLPPLYEPEILELYRPAMPPWPEFLWPQLPEPDWPEMNWPALPKVLWPRLPEMPGLELPPWPEMDLEEWERFELEWPEWDWPDWNLPEAERTRWRRRKPTKKEWPQPWQPFKPEWQRTWPYETEWRGTTWYIPAKPEWRRTWPYKTEWRGITWGDEADNLLRINQLLEIISDEADIAVEQLNDLSDESMKKLNIMITELYEATSADYEYKADTSGSWVQKWATSSVDYTTAWDAMEATTPVVRPDNSTHTGAMGFYNMYRKSSSTGIERWDVSKERGYISFDTSALVGKTVSAAILKIYIYSAGNLNDYETSRVFNVYKLDWGTLGPSDWNGGDLVGTFSGADLIDDEYYEITIDSDYINISGDTQFEIASKSEVDGDVLTDPQDLHISDDTNYYRGGDSFSYYTGDASSDNKPILTITATG